MAFPSFNAPALAWIAPGMFLFSAIGVPPRRAFLIGLTAGLAHFLASIYWLIHMPFTWHGIPLAPAAAWLALSAYCALYPATWVWLCWKIFGFVTTDEFLGAPRWKRMAWAFACGAVWTALEYMRGLFLTGFPWNFVGASQFRMLPLIQLASVTGIYGVSFLVVWTSVALADTALSMVRQPKRYSLWAGAGLPLLAVLGVSVYGVSRLTTVPPPAEKLKVAMVQPSIPQTLIFDPAADDARFNGVLALSEKALAGHPRLLLWPESAVPDLNAETQQTVSDLAVKHKTWIVFCAATSEPAADQSPRYFNSALLCSPQGALESVYNKRRLVIFGEYVPLTRWLPFLRWLTPPGTDLSPGDRPVDFEMANPPAKMSVLICFEDMFPQEAREHVGPETDFLVNLTNDGWFGHGAEQWQQAAGAIFRAVENGIPLLRCTNDGLTCWIDACGRLREVFQASNDVYAAGVMSAEIPLRPPRVNGQTTYNRFGDWFPVGCAGVGVAGLMAALFRRPVSNVPGHLSNA